MATSRTRWVLGLSLAQVALLAATLRVPGLGAETWHHIASLAAVLAVAAILHDRFRSSRRFLALGVLATSVLAAGSGFYLIYWKAGLRVDEIQDWAVFWHIVWSWFVAVFAAQHTWINRRSYAHFLRRSVATRPRALLHGLGYLLLAAALVYTWSPQGRVLFTNENYVPLTLRTWALLGVPTYGGWLYLRWRERRDPGWAEAAFGSRGLRGLVDLLLVPAAALAVLSGFPLLFDGPFDPRGLKYTSKYWHVATSIAFTVLFVVHGAQLWTTVKAHWRTYGRDEPDA